MSRISGSTSIGTPKISQRRSSKPGLSIRWSWVREAVAGSVAKPEPSRSQRNESTVPIRSLPSSRAFLTSSLWRRSQASLAAEK